MKHKCKTYVKPRKKLELIVWKAKESKDKNVILTEYWDCLADTAIQNKIDESRGK